MRLRFGIEGRKAIDDCADYLIANRARLDYKQALAAGFPIATGVIEGACKHLVKARMDAGGAKWHLAGAEAILALRSLLPSGDWVEYWAFHRREELKRVRASRYAGEVPDPLAGGGRREGLKLFGLALSRKSRTRGGSRSRPRVGQPEAAAEGSGRWAEVDQSWASVGQR